MSDEQKGSLIHDFTRGVVMGQLIRFSLPLFFSNLLQAVYNTVDMIIVGKTLGKAGLSAVSVGGNLTGFLTFVAIGFSSAAQIIISQYIGGGKKDQIGRLIGVVFSFLFRLSVLVSIPCLIFRKSLLVLLNTPEESYRGALEYSTVCMCGLIFIYGYNAVSAVLRGMGDSRHPFLFISFAAFLNVLLDILLVMVLETGAGGAALATVISQTVSFLLCIGFLYKRRNAIGVTVKISFFLKPDRAMQTELIRLGLPLSLKSAAVQTSMLFVNSWINSYGVAVSAFAGVANKVNNMNNTVANAISTAGASIMAQNMAARKYERVRKTLYDALFLAGVMALAFSTGLILFPERIYGLFTNDAEVLMTGIHYIPIAVLQFLSSAGRSPMNALISGSGKFRVNFITAILDGVVVRIGLSLLLGLGFGLKAYGFWLGDAIASFTPFFVGLIFYLKGYWKK